MKVCTLHRIFPVVLGALLLAPQVQGTLHAQGAQQSGASSAATKGKKHDHKKGATPAAAPAASAAPASSASSAKPAATPAASPAPKSAAAPQTPPSPGMVWVNTNSKVYHKSGSKFYGKTKAGKWMNEQDAVKAGYKAASN